MLRTRGWLESAVEVTERRREAFQTAGDQLDEATDGSWVLEYLERDLRDLRPSDSVIVDSVRIAKQIDAIRAAYGAAVTHIHLTAPQAVLAERYAKREGESGHSESLTYEEAHRNPTEFNVDELQGHSGCCY